MGVVLIQGFFVGIGFGVFYYMNWRNTSWPTKDSAIRGAIGGGSMAMASCALLQLIFYFTR